MLILFVLNFCVDFVNFTCFCVFYKCCWLPINKSDSTVISPAFMFGQWSFDKKDPQSFLSLFSVYLSLQSSLVGLEARESRPSFPPQKEKNRRIWQVFRQTQKRSILSREKTFGWCGLENEKEKMSMNQREKYI